MDKGKFWSDLEAQFKDLSIDLGRKIAKQQWPFCIKDLNKPYCVDTIWSMWQPSNVFWTGHKYIYGQEGSTMYNYMAPLGSDLNMLASWQHPTATHTHFWKVFPDFCFQWFWRNHASKRNSQDDTKWSIWMTSNYEVWVETFSIKICSRFSTCYEDFSETHCDSVWGLEALALLIEIQRAFEPALWHKIHVTWRGSRCNLAATHDSIILIGFEGLIHEKFWAIKP